MQRSHAAFRTVLPCAMFLMAAIPCGLWAAPPPHANAADPNRGEGCIVADANLATYIDPDCTYHEVLKNVNGIVTVLHYQDHGRVPPGAPLPATTLHNILHVNCECPYDGDYLETITPSGEYHSQGPLRSR